MSRLTNDFSWSFSRHHSFQTCLKRYFFAYYAAWGGWNAEAPPAARELYTLKRLYTRRQWAGHHAHQAIETLIRHGRRDPEPARRAEDRQIDLMRREFRESRAGVYRRDPVRTTGLFEHEYQVAVSDEEWKAIVERTATAIRRFLHSPLWAELQAMPDDRILAVERRAHFTLDGLKVRAVPDLVIRENNRVRIFDWKTGTAPLDSHRLQLGIYVLLAQDRWTADPDEIEAIACNPASDEQASFRYSADELETLREFIRDSADEMLFPLANPERNDPGDGELFDCTENPAPCPTCPFLRICPRWQTGAGPSPA